MKKWPRRWLEVAAFEYTNGHLRDDHGQQILDALDAVGALKPVPKPKEVWVCTRCGAVRDQLERPGSHSAQGPIARMECSGYFEIYVRKEDSDDR